MIWRDVLPNPFLLHNAAGNAAPANPAPGLAAGAATITPDDIAWAEKAIDDYERACPNTASASIGQELVGPTPATSGYPCCPDCGIREPCDHHCPHGRFVVDEAAFMAEVEPVPAFLTENIREHYFGDPADEIEKLLELARAEEWPAPPRRMRA